MNSAQDRPCNVEHLRSISLRTMAFNVLRAPATDKTQGPCIDEFD